MNSKAIIYCRVSSKKQVTEGDGLGSQEHRCLQFAASMGLEVEKIFHEEGFTGEGDFMARPAMRRLLDYLAEHAETHYNVIFDDLKRFARDTLFHFKLKQELALHGAIPLCPNFKFEVSPEGVFVETLYAAFGQLERQQNQRQVVQRMKARLERGYWVFKIPQAGYKYTMDPIHGKLSVPDMPNARIVKSALEGFASSRFRTKRDVMQFLAKHPLIVKGQPLKIRDNLVDRILRNVFYAGIIDYPKWNVHQIKGQHEALISLATFGKIQARLIERAPVRNVASPSDFHLTQLISCAHCGHPLTSSRSKGRSKYYEYYTCKKNECPAKLKNILREVLEAAYVKFLEQVTPPEEIVALVMDELRKIFHDQKAIHDELHSKHQVTILAKEHEMKKFQERLCATNSPILQSTYEKKVEEIAEELEKLKREKKQVKTPDLDQLLGLAEDFMRTAHQGWENRSRITKTDIHRMMFPVNPTYSAEEGMRTATNALPYTLCTRLQQGDFLLVDLKGNLANQLLETFLAWEPVLSRLTDS